MLGFESRASVREVRDALVPMPVVARREKKRSAKDAVPAPELLQLQVTLGWGFVLGSTADWGRGGGVPRALRPVWWSEEAVLGMAVQECSLQARLPSTGGASLVLR